ncbi:serine/threonine-protein kinase [Myxococcus landrumensis]|uniref:Protein kinase n=1 Tax=Myxococcus landrumensis TaxID=2813577 RepID=A0ABX7N058_9BACT|nr:serine/threonine-protein kinase [Myxococcus landrumus]QSQ11122.1 protein kinase [Myxococcus landrumus]
MSSSTTKDIPLGTVLRDTYEISGVLGRGGMGTVFLARHLRLPGRQVAIKVLRHDASLGKEVYLRFRREAEIASRLGHPNIVEVIDFDALEDGSPFLVMEHLRGVPLSRRLRKGAPLTLAEVYSIARQMGSALQAAHGAGVVHRDLKPGNVFLVPMEVAGMAVEHVKLLDFGISKIIDSKTVQTQDAILLGTPQYMAPEQATGKNKDVDPRTDIFSFGCMVYEMLARRLPFKDEGILPELIYRIVYDPPEPLAVLAPETPAHVVRAVEKALAKRPEDRFVDVSAFIAALTGTPLRTVTPPPDAPRLAPVQSAAQGPTATVQPRPIASPPSRPPTVPAAPRRPPERGVAPALAEPVQRATRDESGHAAEGPRRSERDAAHAHRSLGEPRHAAEVHAVSAQGHVSRSPESSPVGLFGKSVRVSPPKAVPIAPPVPDDAMPVLSPRPLSVGPPDVALAAPPVLARPHGVSAPAVAKPPAPEELDAFPEPETIRSPSHGVVSLGSRQRWVRVAVVMVVLAALGAGLWLLRSSFSSSRTSTAVPSSGSASRVVPDCCLSQGTRLDA